MKKYILLSLLLLITNIQSNPTKTSKNKEVFIDKELLDLLLYQRKHRDLSDCIDFFEKHDHENFDLEHAIQFYEYHQERAKLAHIIRNIFGIHIYTFSFHEKPSFQNRKNTTSRRTHSTNDEK